MKTMTVYIGNEPEPEDRLKIEVEQSDYERNCPPRGSRGQGWLTDVRNGDRYLVRRASCGLPRCLCALALVKIVEPNSETGAYSVLSAPTPPQG